MRSDIPDKNDRTVDSNIFNAHVEQSILRTSPDYIVYQEDSERRFLPFGENEKIVDIFSILLNV